MNMNTKLPRPSNLYLFLARGQPPLPPTHVTPLFLNISNRPPFPPTQPTPPPPSSCSAEHHPKGIRAYLTSHLLVLLALRLHLLL